MTFDKEEHKAMALKLLDSMTIGGQLLDVAYDFKQAVLKAEVEDGKPKGNVE